MAEGQYWTTEGFGNIDVEAVFAQNPVLAPACALCQQPTLGGRGNSISME